MWINFLSFNLLNLLFEYLVMIIYSFTNMVYTICNSIMQGTEVQFNGMNSHVTQNLLMHFKIRAINKKYIKYVKIRDLYFFHVGFHFSE